MIGDPRAATTVSDRTLHLCDVAAIVAGRGPARGEGLDPPPSVMSPPVLIVPGWTNSGSEHWQSLWQRAHPEWRRVEQADWDRPDPEAWRGALEAAVRDTWEPRTRPEERA